ncbi:hypothetical protein TNIN_273291 [Trichonephila inaurata madagascariensis]|uniref:Uncharacterized protein n=1 Tax=Trichonephila inaurata madagascariensis TaxID=2747483 RepID=A0A8X6MFL7_9ARAC|nr:hypothetical protein TNIN_273291 [Trichonephila inaurata madagascariensis]
MIKISAVICRGVPCRKSDRILRVPELKVLRSQPTTVMEPQGNNHATALFMKKIQVQDSRCGNLPQLLVLFLVLLFCAT